MTRSSVFAVLIGTFLAWATAAAQTAASPATRPGAEPENPLVWQPRTKSVAVFKNGLGFFMREGQTSLHRGWCNADQVPPAAFGALAFYALGEGQAVDIVGAGPGETVDFDDVDAPSKLNDKRDRLRACLNLKVCLTHKHAGNSASAAGKLISVGDDFVVLQADPHNLAVRIEEIVRLQVLDLPLRVHVAGASDAREAKCSLGMAYLRQGITWVPEYTLKILDDRTAELTLRGTLINEAEDLVHCDVHFVVGVPHFVHSDRMAPLAIGQVIRTIASSIVPAQVMSQIANNAMAIPASGADRTAVTEREVSAAGGNVRDLLGKLPNMDGPASADYTVYTKNDLTIRRGEKAIVTLFRRKIAYAHVYRWAPPAKVEHLLALQNDTDTAWTTGPCLAMSNVQPLGEDLLRYTPRKGTCEMLVTTAVNVLCEKKESEAERKMKAYEPSHGFFADQVSLRGELTIRNLDKSEVNVIIDNPVTGKPTEASDDGTLTIDTTKLQLLERAGSIHWNLRVAPGESKTLTYTLERYVPSK